MDAQTAGPIVPKFGMGILIRNISKLKLAMFYEFVGVLCHSDALPEAFERAAPFEKTPRS